MHEVSVVLLRFERIPKGLKWVWDIHGRIEIDVCVR